jgi:hypothetical protein
MFKREVCDKRNAKKRERFRPQQSQLLSSASVVPQKRGQEAGDEDENDEDNWAEIAWEGWMAEVKKGEISQLEFYAEFML